MKKSLMAAVFVAGCAAGDSTGRGGDTPSPLALADAYLIAHGMAASYAARPDAKPAIVDELAHLDARARAGLLQLGRDEAGGRAAVSAFADFAAHRSAAPAAAQGTASP